MRFTPQHAGICLLPRIGSSWDISPIAEKRYRQQENTIPMLMAVSIVARIHIGDSRWKQNKIGMQRPSAPVAESVGHRVVLT